MGEFLKFNSIPIPVEDNRWQVEPEFQGSPIGERNGIELGADERFEHGVWQGRTTILTPAQIDAYVGLMNGEFDVFTYEDAALISERKLAVRNPNGSRAANPKFGTYCLTVNSGAVATLPSEIGEQYALFTYKEDSSGEYTSYKHVAYRSSDTSTWENGAVDGTENALNWHSVSGKNLLLNGKDDVGTNSAADYDNTVVCWFTPTDEMMAIWGADGYQWESTPPYLKMTGDGVRYRAKEAYVVRVLVTNIKPQQATINGVWYPNAGRIEFEVHEVEAIYAGEVTLAGSSAGQGSQVSALTVGSSFTTPTPPGAPFADYNAQSLATGNVSTWTNEGSDATGDVSTFGTSNAPECIAAGAGSPVTGAKYVRFDSANSEALQGAFTTLRATGVRFAMVARVATGAPPGTFYWFDGNASTNRNALLFQGNEYDLYSGAQPGSGAMIEKQKWVRIIGEFGAGGRLVVERATRIDVTSGTNSLSGLTIGARYSEANYGPIEVARLTMWDDGTPLHAIESWLEEAYPFEAVPPGNPKLWFDPNDYAVGSVSTVTDKGSAGLNGTATSLSVSLDAQCTEQKVFNCSTGGYFTVASASLSADWLVGVMVRPTTVDVTRNIFGGMDGTTGEVRGYLSSANRWDRVGGSTVNGQDLDLLAPFNTSLRWMNLQSREAAAGAGGDSIVDGTSSATSDAGNNTLASGMAFFARWNGSSYASPLNGYASDILVYDGSTEANAARAAEVEEWLQRWRRLATQPGAPQLDVDAEALVLTDNDPVSTWTNDGSGGNLTQTGASRPTYKDAGGPEPTIATLDAGNGNARVLFDGSDDFMEEATRANLTQPTAFAVVWRVAAKPAAGLSDVLIHSNDVAAAHMHTLVASGSNVYPRINAGASVDDPNPYVELNTWYASAGEINNTTSHVWWTSSGTTTGVSGTAGTEEQAETKVGGYAASNSNLDGDIARVVIWDDGTTFEQAQEWVKRRYPNVDPYGPGR